MISRRLSACLVALPLAVSLAACGSGTTDGGGPDSSSPSVASSAPSSATTSATSDSSAASSSSDAGGSADAAKLVATMRASLASVTSLTFTTETKLSGTSLSGSGKQKIADGQLTGLDITQKTPGGQIRIIIADGKTYLKQPGVSTNPAKPYVLVTKNSSNPLVRRLATSLEQSLSQASVQNSVAFLAAAKSVSEQGKESVNGQDAVHYKLVVDPSKLPADSTTGQQIQQAGIKQLPVDIYLDDEGRPVKTSTTLKVQGQEVTSEFVITGFDVPVTITAPPASQVSR